MTPNPGVTYLKTPCVKSDIVLTSQRKEFLGTETSISKFSFGSNPNPLLFVFISDEFQKPKPYRVVQFFRLSLNSLDLGKTQTGLRGRPVYRENLETDVTPTNS